MRIVAADTSPLNYLVLVGEVDVLSTMFGTILVPEVVRGELARAEAPSAVRAWLEAQPAWPSIHPDEAVADPELGHLDVGERTAITLAVVQSADLILMDDRAGVAAARQRGFRVVGTLGLLDLAASRALLDARTTVARLRATNFRCPPEMLKAVLAKHRDVQGGDGSRCVTVSHTKGDDGASTPRQRP